MSNERNDAGIARFLWRTAIGVLVPITLLFPGPRAIGSAPQQNEQAAQELQRMVERGDPRAIPALEGAFQKVSEKAEKQMIASDLVKLGDKNEDYWNFLVRYAEGTVNSDMPFPIQFTSEGRDIPQQYSPEFLDWCKRHGVAPDTAAQEAVRGMPTDVTALGLTGDPRALKILLRGLESPNYYVAAQSAKGLARIQDPRAIKPIIRACERAPGVAAELVARSLVFFSDPEAQAAAARFIRTPGLLDALREHARTKGAEGVFQVQ